MSPSQQPKKSLGQHWLFDSFVLEDIVETAEINKGDTVLEVGPGLGTLTDVLLKKGAKVTAVEKDEQLAKDLVNRIRDSGFYLQVGDILEFDLASIKAPYKVVANIPYYLTSNLIRTLAESSNSPETITLLVQKEVAERICAKPGKTSLISISAQFYYDCYAGSIVPAKFFTPPPKVDSQIVHMVKLHNKVHQNIDARHFFRIVKAGFSSRRKTLLNTISSGLVIDKNLAKKYLLAAGIDPGLRAQALSLEQWSRLYDVISNA